MNWSVIKDKRWLIFQSASILLAIIAVVMAVNNNSYWVLFVALSMLLMVVGTNRAAKVTHGKPEIAENKQPPKK
ncbi:hypothetical protein [Salimicrobium salexigens]|uniref:Uncharacterized protein n=1 Tax=Salimicrobium salexigens TaxID=908941 RepID=A0ABY1KQX1_9BACI|nr:hypothetical protein [Salimicrobium salexigens]SIS66499.1 hypothetical protein SAMN05421758_103262 [Salimicrobium salexigens]